MLRSRLPAPVGGGRQPLREDVSDDEAPRRHSAQEIVMPSDEE